MGTDLISWRKSKKRNRRELELTRRETKHLNRRRDEVEGNKGKSKLTTAALKKLGSEKVEIDYREATTYDENRDRGKETEEKKGK